MIFRSMIHVLVGFILSFKHLEKSLMLAGQCTLTVLVRACSAKLMGLFTDSALEPVSLSIGCLVFNSGDPTPLKWVKHAVFPDSGLISLQTSPLEDLEYVQDIYLLGYISLTY